MTEQTPEQREDALERQQRLEQEDLESVLSIAPGRRLLWSLIERSGAFGASYSPDTHEMAYTEGRRSTGLELLLRIQQRTPNRWLEMLSETMEARAAKQR